MAKNKPQQITFETRQEGESDATYMTAPWPELASISVDSLAGCSDFATLNPDGSIYFLVGNGSATYVRATDGKDGAGVYALQEGSAYEDAPPVQAEEAAEDEDFAEVEEPVVLDTRAAEEPQPPPVKRFSDRIADGARDASRAGDHPRHAGLHHLDAAFGTFKAACKDGAQHFDPGSEEYEALLDIAERL